LGPSAAPKPVEVATLAAPGHLAGRPSVAVLPFKNLSGDATQDFFSDGITEDVINALGHFSNLLVVAKSASFQFKERSLAPAELGRLLDARYLLEGSVRRAGDSRTGQRRINRGGDWAARLVRKVRLSV
jgi:TolB-like protein